MSIAEMGNMRVSIIIPVYNAHKYVDQAVKSALSQAETGEVILIEDGSTDGSRSACEALAKGNEKVRLLTHTGGRNRGAAASRNVGIVNAKSDFIAFLDADDFYLPRRFHATQAVFAKYEDAEGIYEATGTHFESEQQERMWKALGHPLITTVKQGVSPDSIFEQQAPVGHSGHCHLNGLTVKRTVFRKSGLFDADMDLVEDITFLMKLAACTKLYLGNVIAPVAMRRVHFTNRVTSKRRESELWQLRLKMWTKIHRWLRIHTTRPTWNQLVIRRMLWECQTYISPRWSFPMRAVVALSRYATMLYKEPAFLKEKVFIIGTLAHVSRLLLGRSSQDRRSCAQA
jgi:glycosyltransferase involved in cell wall biosynthesis